VQRLAGPADVCPVHELVDPSVPRELGEPLTWRVDLDRVQERLPTVRRWVERLPRLRDELQRTLPFADGTPPGVAELEAARTAREEAAHALEDAIHDEKKAKRRRPPSLDDTAADVRGCRAACQVTRCSSSRKVGS